MINIIKKEDCCGCGACVQRCPKQCITMKEDNEGFLYPTVDAEICIDCGLCEKVCPFIKQASPQQPLKVYAAYNKDEEIRMQSSSGGIFTLLAEETINKMELSLESSSTKTGCPSSIILKLQKALHHFAVANMYKPL